MRGELISDLKFVIIHVILFIGSYVYIIYRKLCIQVIEI